MGCDRVRYLRLQRFTSRKEVIHGNPQKAGLEEDHEICGQARSEGQGKEEVNSTPRSVETNISPGLVPGRSFLAAGLNDGMIVRNNRLNALIDFG